MHSPSHATPLKRIAILGTASLLAGLFWYGQASAQAVYCIDAAGNRLGTAGPPTVGTDKQVVCGVGASATGANAVSIGYLSSASINSSVSIGQNAGYNATSGGSTNPGAVFVGFNTGYSSTGHWNTFVGSQNAGRSSIGDANSAYGQASFANGKGSYNTTVGGWSGNNAVGSNNVALGFYAGASPFRATDGGNNNIAIGSQSGWHIRADDTISIGNLSSAWTGRSVALGSYAESAVVNSVALGYESLASTVVQTSQMTVNGTTYDVAGIAGGTVSIGNTGAERTITNMAAGRVSSTSTDGINGSQLWATQQEIALLGQKINDLPAPGPGPGPATPNAVTYDTHADGSRANSVTLQGGDPSAPVLLSNVAPGKADTDAVNVRQLKENASSTLASANAYTDGKAATTLASANAYTDRSAVNTLSSANAYTDRKFRQLSQNIEEVRGEARQAAAIGLAAAALRYDDRPGKLSAAVGGGFWRGENATAVGLGYTNEKQDIRGSVAGTTSGGNWGVNLGLTLTLN